jgi:hypothetical protein
MKSSVIEGTWDELAKHADELRRYPKLTLIVPEAEEPAPAVNQGMLDALREITERQRGRRSTSPDNTDRWLREARDGGMYGLGPTSDE